MFDFLSYGFGSVFGGFVTSVIIVGGVIVFATQYSRRSALSPLGIVCALILWGLLFFQTTSFYAAWGAKSEAVGLVSSLQMQFGDTIDGEAFGGEMRHLLRENPLLQYFVGQFDLSDVDWSNPIVSMKSVVAREYNYFMLRRLAWSLAFIAIFGFVIVKTVTSSKRERKHKTRIYDEDDSGYNFDD